MTLAANIVFWSSVFVLFYIYVGYSITIAALALVVRRPVRKNDDHEPTVV